MQKVHRAERRFVGCGKNKELVVVVKAELSRFAASRPRLVQDRHLEARHLFHILVFTPPSLCMRISVATAVFG